MIHASHDICVVQYNNFEFVICELLYYDIILEIGTFSLKV